MVIGLGIRPSVCLGQILKSSDEIRCGNGVLALGTKEFRNLVLLHSEVEVRRSVGPSANVVDVKFYVLSFLLKYRFR